jgi:hypothetical protein
MDRQAAIDKINGVFDALDKIAWDSTYSADLHRIAMIEDTDHSIGGVVLVRRPRMKAERSFITWGLSPYNSGLHSGHYDMSPEQAENDWYLRCTRGG